MWEAIASNQRRSWWLISLMGLLLILLGTVIGLAVVMYMEGASQRPGAPTPSFWQQVMRAQAGAYFGIAAAVFLWLILWLTAATGGERILLSGANAREIQKDDAPQLWNVVEEMTIASGLPKMPRVFVIDDSSLNAFAVGYKPDKAAVAVTAGLLKRLNRDELQGVIAHEIGHIRNQDVRFLTLAGVMVGAIVLISHLFLRGMFYGSVGRSRRSSSKGGGGAAVVMLVIAILVAVLAPLAAQVLYFACSRRREFLADASSARFTRYPPGLASALEKISHRASPAGKVNQVVAPMYIINPLQGASALQLFATHPDTTERIRILRSMSGAGFAEYEAAYQKARGESRHCIGQRTLSESDAVAIREPQREPESRQSAVDRARAVGEMLDHILPLVIIPCVCGVRLKLPEGFKKDKLKCPRCGREHDVPRAGAGSDDGPPQPKPPMRYRRKSSGWETFQCGCGHPVQLSPRFSASSINCPKCKARIEIEEAD